MTNHIARNSVFAAFTFAALFLFSFTASAAKTSGSWEKAAELIQAGNSKEAVEQLTSLLAAEPGNVLYLRLKGIAELQLGREDEAVKTLREAVRLEPTCVACGFYLAQALAYRGNVAEATLLLKIIIREVPESRYAEQANRILPELERLASTARVIQDKRRWNISTRTALEYDDNVVNGSYHEGEPTANSLRWIMGGYLEVRPVDQNIDPLPFTLGTGYAVYQSYHERQNKTLDLTSQTARLFLSHAGRVAMKPYRIEIGSDYTYGRLGNKPFSHEVSITPRADLQWLSWTMSSIHYKVRWKAFDNDTLIPQFFSRDGWSHSFGFLQRFFLFKNTAALDVTYDFTWDNAQGSQFDRQINNEAGLALNLSLPWKIRWTSGVGYHNDSYSKFQPIPKRRDQEWSAFASLSRPLFIPQLSAELTYTHAGSLSNQDFADTRRNIYGLGLNYYY